MAVSLGQIGRMSYNKLAYGVSTGEISITDVRIYYSSARKRALSRSSRISKTTEFGTIEKVDFAKLRELKTTEALLHEVHDLNKFLSAKSSTIKGLKEIRAEQLKIFHENNIDFVNESNYGRFVDFLKWFRSSEYAKFYDSNDDEVGEIFLQAGENATPEDWKNLFKEFLPK